MMNQVNKYSIELGESFDIDSSFTIYNNWEKIIGWTDKRIIEVEPGTEVQFLDFKVTVPEDATKLVKFNKGTSILAFFLTSDNKLPEYNVAYIVKPLENWIELEEADYGI